MKKKIQIFVPNNFKTTLTELDVITVLVDTFILKKSPKVKSLKLERLTRNLKINFLKNSSFFVFFNFLFRFLHIFFITF